MASPTVVTQSENLQAADNTAFQLALSTFGAGTLAVAILGCDGDRTIDWTDANGWDFTEFGSLAHSSGFKIFFAYRVLDGSEGTAIVTCSAAEKMAAIVYEVSGAADPGTQPPEVTTFASAGVSTTADPPAITPTGGSKDYLFFAGAVQDGEEDDDDTWCNGAPTNYTNLRQKTSGIGGAAGTNVSLATAERALTASSENPDNAMSFDQSKNYLSFTVAVHPPTAAAPGPQIMAHMRRQQARATDLW